MKTYLTYGFALALGGLLLNVVLFFFGFHSDVAKLGTGQLLGTIGGLAISVAGIVLGTKARRADVPASEPFGYGRALGAGVMISLFAGLFGIASQWIYGTLINPEMTEIIVQAQLQKLQETGMTSEQIESAEPMMRKMLHPAIMAGGAFVGALVMGTLLSLVTAAFLKRSPTAAPPPMPAASA